MTAAPEPFTPYQRRLFAFLSVATFFEGFDNFTLTQVLTQLREEFHLSRTAGGLLLGVANLGASAAFILIRDADRRGRRPILALTIWGYTLASLASALAPGVYLFALCQFVARVFLLAEWAVAMIYAAEEFPAARRGVVIGVIQAVSSLGSVVCAGVVPLLVRLPWGWRSVYLAGVPPLLIMAFARRNLRETTRFEEERRAGRTLPRPLGGILRGPYRRRVLEVALAWALTYVCTQTAVSFWKDYAVTELRLTDKAAGGVIVVAALVSMPLVFAVGRAMDRLGRRRGAALVYTVTALGVLGAYQAPAGIALTCAVIAAVFGVSSVIPVLNAFTTELFPTEMRADAFAWANNVLGRATYVLSPWVIGWLADRPGVGYRGAVSLTALFPLLALAVILVCFPETAGKELEETSAPTGAH
ncbi:MAG: MFS transporter [Deltaproteobacteria bacterium]|nr:MFS transporter [Deltaproteobacteria bacterium]